MSYTTLGRSRHPDALLLHCIDAFDRLILAEPTNIGDTFASSTPSQALLCLEMFMQPRTETVPEPSP